LIALAHLQFKDGLAAAAKNMHLIRETQGTRTTAMRVISLDHLVPTLGRYDLRLLCARAVDAVVTLGDGRKALAFGSQRINLPAASIL
jgi:hypothetical protein